MTPTNNMQSPSQVRGFSQRQMGFQPCSSHLMYCTSCTYYTLLTLLLKIGTCLAFQDNPAVGVHSTA